MVFVSVFICVFVKGAMELEVVFKYVFFTRRKSRMKVDRWLGQVGLLFDCV